MSKYLFILSFILFVLPSLSFAQAKSWTAKDPFEKRCFIENVGQVNESVYDPAAEILYHSYSKGVHFYFTRKGIIFKTGKKVERSRKEMRALLRKHEEGASEENEKEKESELKYKTVPLYLEFQWQNANPHVKTEPEFEIKTRYLSGEKGTNKTISARAFKELIYYNLYEGINVHVLFPHDSSGIKYYYELQPGADVSVIREKWIGQKSITQSLNGDLAIASAFGKFTAAAPVTYAQQNKKSIGSAYKLNGNVVTYHLDNPANEAVIIDPWIIAPSFMGGTRAFDVDYDKAGNTYVYGGVFPHELLKYDVAGALVWSYTTNLFNEPFPIPNYGDFAVDHFSGSIYLVNGYSSGIAANVIKLSPDGSFVADHYGGAAMLEMWRIAFSSCTNQAVIGGGGTGGVDQMCYLDTNLTALTTVNPVGATGCCADIALLTVDNYGYCYYLHSLWGPMSNEIVKSPMPSFLPIVYNVPTGFSFQEVGSIGYYIYAGSSNGYNGLVVANKSLYAYDSYHLKKFDATTGASLLTKTIQVPPFPGDETVKYWGGLTADDCQNIFFGKRDTIVQVDSLLNEIAIYIAPDSIYDLKISKTGMLHVTGANFVQTLVPTGMNDCDSPIAANLSVTPASCFTGGSASVNPDGGQPPYSVVWSTIPAETGLTVSDLAPGDYYVIIRDSSCNGNEDTVAFTIIAGPGAFITTVDLQLPSCPGTNDGSITLTTVGGNDPYTYVWDTLGITGPTASGLGFGIYEIAITDSVGCSNSIDVLLLDPSPVTITVTPDSISCAGGTSNLVCIPAGGSSPFTVLWNTPTPVLNDTLYAAVAGTYSVTVTDSNGCAYNFTTQLFEPLPLALSIETDSVGCLGTPLGSMVATVSGGTGPFTYLWSNNVSNNTNTNPGLNAGVYTLTVTDDNGCTIMQTDTVFELIFPSMAFTAVQPCNSGSNGSITATPTGGSTAAFNYSWNTVPVQTGLVATG
ncbi:MAG TPA: SprB repeat-containing protein, partial [Flavobacteriales bacterium]|nr:SprB repeat-containing protein [Flavobacteriales bacterium]